MDNKQNTEFNIPCDGCILLPKCIQRYKDIRKDDFYRYPMYKIKDECSILSPIYKKLDIILYESSSSERENQLDKWWKDNYE